MEQNQKSNETRISCGFNLSSDPKVAFEELRNMSNEELDALIANRKPNPYPFFIPTKNRSTNLLEKDLEFFLAPISRESFDNFIKAIVDSGAFNTIEEQNQTIKSSQITHINEHDENINPKFTKENDELLRKNIDDYFIKRHIGVSALAEKDKMEKIFKEAREFASDDTNTIYPISKPFSNEKQIPTEKEFKDEAKRLKASGNFSSLGAAQNELAKAYGFKEYRAIKSRFTK